MAKGKAKGKELTARRGRSTVLKRQGSYQAEEACGPSHDAPDAHVRTARLKDPKTCFSFSKIHLNITKF